MKINNFRGDFADISAKKEALVDLDNYLFIGAVPAVGCAQQLSAQPVPRSCSGAGMLQ